ncbi:MAG TPA: ThiF family adenylyltransferase [Kofleriaceae bacterium]|nr:ThiF family adenylyltransferase [Kofleriaceae bacterium]
MTTARQENARTLAVLLNLDEGQAEKLLDATAVITSGAGGEPLADNIGALLARTLTTVRYDVAPNVQANVEVVVGSVTPRTTAPIVGVGVGDYRLEVRDGASALGTNAAHDLIVLIAAGYAAAIAAHRALGLDASVALRLPIEIDFTALYGPGIARLHRRLDLGLAYLAGAGAIGNAVVLGLSTLDVHGELQVCDPDKVSDGNLNRCWWFTPADIGEKKCARLAHNAQPEVPGLRLVPRDGTLKQAFKADGEKPIETMIVAADSRRVRRSLQSEMPRRVYDASTTGIEEFVLHFNEIPSDLACMSCIYYEDADERTHETHVADLLGISAADVRASFVSAAAARAILEKYPHLRVEDVEGQACDTLFKQLCARGELKGGNDDGERVLAPFGFVSVLAGLYLALEIALRVHATNDAPNCNFWRLSPWSAPVARARVQREKRPNCEFCGNPILQEVVRGLWRP